MTNKRADWTAWILQFIAGLTAGAVAGFFFGMGRRSIVWLRPDLAPYFILGMALIGAGLASHYGDRLWFGSKFNELLYDDLRQSKTSVMCSFVAGLIGFGLIVYTLVRL